MIIKDLKHLTKITEDLKIKGKTIATCNGSFDLLHAGHLYLIGQAKAEGDVLFVLLNSDASVKKYKGESRPIIGELERAEMLNALKDVDYVYIFDESTPISVLERIKPHVHVTGPDYGKTKCVEGQTVRDNGGRVVQAKEKQGVLRTSDIISKMNGPQKEEKGGVFLDRDGVINVDYGFVGTKERFEFAPGAIEGLKLLNSMGLDAFVISTQSGVGRGYFSEEDVAALTDFMLEEIEANGGKIKEVSYCFHHPDQKCECRKPNPKLTLDLLKNEGLVARKSYFVSDTKNDILMAKKLNMKTIWVKSDLNNPKNKVDVEPDYIVENLLEAAEIINQSVTVISSR